MVDHDKLMFDACRRQGQAARIQGQADRCLTDVYRWQGQAVKVPRPSWRWTTNTLELLLREYKQGQPVKITICTNPYKTFLLTFPIKSTVHCQKGGLLKRSGGRWYATKCNGFIQRWSISICFMVFWSEFIQLFCQSVYKLQIFCWYRNCIINLFLSLFF